ncbi:MAG: hypothetical protein EG824_00460 [Deltaproteobacteria bacterium]|nr:hypothetical protein [Deltaproteobacteria bacterium]
MVSPFQATSFVFVAGLLWASAGLIGGQIALSSLALAEFRLMMAAVVLILVLAIKNIPLWSVAKANRRVVCLAALGMAGFQWSFFFAVQKTNASFATWASVASGPLCVHLIKEARSIYRHRALDFGAVALGLGLMAIADELSGVGILSSLAAGLCYALYAISVMQVEVPDKRYSEFDVNLMSTGLALFGSAIMILPFAAFEFASFPIAEISPGDCFRLVLLGMLSTTTAYLLLALGMNRLSAEQALRLQWVQPIATEIFSYLLDGATPSSGFAIGMGLLLLSLLNLSQRRSQSIATSGVLKPFSNRV